MKRLHLFCVGVMCYVLVFNAHAQLLPNHGKLLPEKQALFGRLPEQFTVTFSWLDKLFSGPDTGAVKIPVMENTFFEGVISEKVQMNPHVTSINIKSSNYQGALLSVSKITYNDATIKYIGRIMNIQYGDLFELVQENNTIYFKKKKQSLVVTE